MAALEFETALQDTATSLADWDSLTEILYGIGGSGDPLFCTRPLTLKALARIATKDLRTNLVDAQKLIGDLGHIGTIDVTSSQAFLDLAARASTVRSCVKTLLARVNTLDLVCEVILADLRDQSAENANAQQIKIPRIFSELYRSIQSLFASIYLVRQMAGLNITDGFC